jgi:hypothetical protein
MSLGSAVDLIRFIPETGYLTHLSPVSTPRPHVLKRVTKGILQVSIVPPRDARIRLRFRIDNPPLAE